MVANESSGELLNIARPRRRVLLQVLALIFSVYVVEQAVEAMLWDTGQQPGAGYIGAEHTTFRPTVGCGQGCVTVDQVDPGSPLAKAGVASGDHIRFDRVWDQDRHIAAGERLGFGLQRDGRWTHGEVVAVPHPPVGAKASLVPLLYDLLTLSTCLFGILVLSRSGGRTVPLLLGLALTCYGLIDGRPQLWEEAPATFLPFALINYTDFLSIFVLFAVFSVAFARDAAQIRLGRWKYLFGLYVGAFYGVGYWRGYAEYTVSPASYYTATAWLEAMTYPIYAVTFFYMYLGWNSSGALDRRRCGLMLVAFGLLVVSQLLSNFVVWDLGVQNYASNPLELAAAILYGLIAPALFAYAILRHKVLDLGFALNRTLVYGAVSALLLGAFGLTEWAVDHFAPIEGRETNALVDAAIALAVFLAFHRVRDLVEHGVKGLFFRRWRKAEQGLRRFVRDAPFITEEAALTAAFAGALGAFADGAAGAAIYLRDGSGYLRVAGAVGDAPSRLDPNLPALVRLRADAKAFEPQDADSQAALLAPMVNRNEIIGLAMLGSKSSGEGYRPDEIELIDWATRQVGSDLHSLRVQDLEQQVMILNAKLDGVLALARQTA